MERNERQITIDDIARALGVSKTTVSRAISGKGRIGKDTRQRVLHFIAEHNFRPNAVAQGLAHSRSGNIGVVMPDAREDGSFFAACLAGICTEAAQRDCDVLIAADDGLRQMERILANRKVDGVIATRSERCSSILPLLRAQNVPYVIIGQSGDPTVVCVDNDNRGGCRELTAKLLGRGLRRLALLGGDENYLVTQSRLDGFLDAHREAGVEPLGVVRMNIRDSAGASAAVDAALAEDAQALLCMDGFICNLAMIQLRERDIPVPGSLRVASFFDNSIMEHLIPSVTSLRFDAEALGREACRALLERLEGGSPRSRVLSGYQLIERESTR